MHRNTKATQLIERLQWLCVPENWKSQAPGFNNESLFIELTDAIATTCTNWDNTGSYSDYIELSGSAIDKNAINAPTIDLNTCVATLICVHREQHWNGGWSDVITPRVENGMLLALADRLHILILQDKGVVNDPKS